MKRDIRVFLTDDHRILREALAQLLDATEGFVVVGEAGDGQETLERLPATDPDVAVLDIVMPRLNGIETARWLRENHPRTELVILTGHHNEAHVRECFEAGVRGYVLKEEGSTQLLDAIRLAARGDYYLAGSAGRDLVADYVRPWLARQKPGGVVTPRERQLAILVSDGYSSKEIASFLNISVKTVETHRASLMRKLGARNVADVVKYCIRNQWVEP
jgi:DNA-binding NarL/FixJ family response regulator